MGLVNEQWCRCFLLVVSRLAREAGLEYVEIQNLTEFYDDNRYGSKSSEALWQI